MYQLQTREVIQKAIGGIGKAGIRLARAIQTAAVQCIGHAVMHGDVRLATELVAATPKHQRASLVSFLETYGPFAYRKADKDFAFFAKNSKLKDAGIERNEELTQAYVESLPKWDSMVKPTEAKSKFDASEDFDKQLTRYEKLLQDGKVTVINKELIGDLRAAYNRWSAKIEAEAEQKERDAAPQGDEGVSPEFTVTPLDQPKLVVNQ